MSLEDVADEIYKAGVRDPAKARRLLVFVEVYATQVLPPRTALKPGESDMTRKKTCCTQCFKPKAWRMFPPDKSSPTKRGTMCILCTKKPEGDFELMCKGCKQMRNVRFFIRHAGSSTGYGHYCQVCRS